MDTLLHTCPPAPKLHASDAPRALRSPPPPVPVGGREAGGERGAPASPSRHGGDDADAERSAAPDPDAQPDAQSPALIRVFAPGGIPGRPPAPRPAGRLCGRHSLGGHANGSQRPGRLSASDPGSAREAPGAPLPPRGPGWARPSVCPSLCPSPPSPPSPPLPCSLPHPPIPPPFLWGQQGAPREQGPWAAVCGPHWPPAPAEAPGAVRASPPPLRAPSPRLPAGLPALARAPGHPPARTRPPACAAPPGRPRGGRQPVSPGQPRGSARWDPGAGCTSSPLLLARWPRLPGPRPRQGVWKGPTHFQGRQGGPWGSGLGVGPCQPPGEAAWGLGVGPAGQERGCRGVRGPGRAVTASGPPGSPRPASDGALPTQAAGPWAWARGLW